MQNLCSLTGDRTHASCSGNTESEPPDHREVPNFFKLRKRSRFSHVWLFATPWAVPTRLLHPWDSPGKNTGVGRHSLLQGIFPTGVIGYMNAKGITGPVTLFWQLKYMHKIWCGSLPICVCNYLKLILTEWYLLMYFYLCQCTHQWNQDGWRQLMKAKQDSSQKIMLSSSNAI